MNLGGYLSVLWRALIFFDIIANESAEPRGKAGEAAANKAVCTRGLVQAVGRKNLDS